MITIDDCKAFCDAEPRWADELAQKECLPLLLAYARAHQATLSANDGPRLQPVVVAPRRLVA